MTTINPALRRAGRMKRMGLMGLMADTINPKCLNNIIKLDIGTWNYWSHGGHKYQPEIFRCAAPSFRLKPYSRPGHYIHAGSPLPYGESMAFECEDFRVFFRPRQPMEKATY